MSDNATTVRSHLCLQVGIACCHQSVLVSHSSVKTNTEEGNNRDPGEWRDEKVPDLLKICGEFSVKANWKEYL